MAKYKTLQGKVSEKVNTKDLMLLKKQITIEGVNTIFYDFAIFRVTNSDGENGIVDVKLITGDQAGLIFRDMPTKYSNIKDSYLEVNNYIEESVDAYNCQRCCIIYNERRKDLEVHLSNKTHDLYFIKGDSQVEVKNLEKMLTKLNYNQYKQAVKQSKQNKINKIIASKIKQTEKDNWIELEENEK